MFDKTFLDNLAADKTKLAHFFDGLVGHYESLTEIEQRSFMQKLMDWNEKQTMGWGIPTASRSIFSYAQDVDHGPAIQLLINTRAYRQPRRHPFYAGEDKERPFYYRQLASTYLDLMKPFKTAVHKSLSKIKNFPDAIESIIMDYVLQIPSDPALAAIRADAEVEVEDSASMALLSYEQNEQKEQKGQDNVDSELPNQIGNDIEQKPRNCFYSFLSLCMRAQQEEVPFEEELENKADRKRLSDARKKYFLTMLGLIMLGLVMAALMVATVVMLSLTSPLASSAAVIAFVILGTLNIVISLTVSIYAVMVPMLSLTFLGGTAFENRKNKSKADVTQFYKVETPYLHKFVLGFLVGLVAVSLIALTIGLIALIPPLGLSIPLLACTIGAGAVLAVSAPTLGFFAWNGKKEKARVAEFEGVLAHLAEDEVAQMAP